MAGRPKLPTKIKELQGTLKKSRINDKEPVYKDLKEMPKSPKHLGEWGKSLWQYGEELVRAGVITAPDIKSFELLCETYERYKISHEHISKDIIKNVEGLHGGRSSASQQMNADLSMCIKLMQEFGLTPASRGKFGISNKKEVDPDTEKMKGLLGA